MKTVFYGAMGLGALALAACGGGNDTYKGPRAATKGAGPVLAVITHPVDDYATWQTAYDEFADEQSSRGVVAEQVYRDPEDPNTVIVLHWFESVDAANAFFEDEELRMAMADAGVAGAPTIMIGEAP